MRLLTLRDVPSDLTFAEMKTDTPAPDNTLSLVVGHKTLLLLNLADPDNPLELAFQVDEDRLSFFLSTTEFKFRRGL